MQNYLRVQTKSLNSYNLVETVVKLLTTYKIDMNNQEKVQQCFATITELIQGPCKENQIMVAKFSNFLDYSNKLLNDSTLVIPNYDKYFIYQDLKEKHEKELKLQKKKHKNK